MKAQILPTAPAYASWIDVFGTDTVELASPVARHVTGPMGTRAVYQLDTTALSVRQRQRLVLFLTSFWHENADAVAERLDDPEQGIVIDSADVLLKGVAGGEPPWGMN